MDDDIKKENVQIDSTKQRQILEYTPTKNEDPIVINDRSVISDQEQSALNRIKKIKEGKSNINKYPWEDLEYDGEDEIPNQAKKKYEKKTYTVTPARVAEIQAKNKSYMSYVINSPSGTVNGEDGVSFSIITPPKYSGSIGNVKKYTVTGKPNIFIQEINPATIRINFSVNSDGTFVKRNVGEWMKGDRQRSGFNSFINFSYYEPNTKPTGQFIANGRNYGERTDKKDEWADAPVIVIRPGKDPIFDRGNNWYNAFSSNEVFAEKSGKHGFISEKVKDIRGESVVAANIPLFFENGRMVRNFHSSLIGIGEYTARNFIGSLKDGKWFVGTTESKGNRKSPSDGYDAKDIAEALNKIYVNKIVYAMGTDSGGSTSFVSNGKIFKGSSQGRAIPTILSW